MLPDGEQRQVTILAAAVADHDWLPAALGAPGWADLLARLRAAAEDVVRRHGGLVNRFADGTLEALFGVPVTHEDDPARAARAALELHRRVAALGGAAEGRPPCVCAPASTRDRPAVLPARDAAGPYSVTGPVARLAVELSGHAPPGEVWASADCRRAIAGLFDTEEPWRRSRRRRPARRSCRSGCSIPRSRAPGSRRRSAPGSPPSPGGSGS